MGSLRIVDDLKVLFSRGGGEGRIKAIIARENLPPRAIPSERAIMRQGGEVPGETG